MNGRVKACPPCHECFLEFCSSRLRVNHLARFDQTGIVNILRCEVCNVSSWGLNLRILQSAKGLLTWRPTKRLATTAFSCWWRGWEACSTELTSASSPARCLIWKPLPG